MASILIVWTPGGGANVTSQTVKRSLSGANSYSTIGTVGAAIATYLDTTALDNTLYQYKIVTNCSTGGPNDSVGTNPEAIYITCGTLTSSTSVGINGLGQAYPEISWTIPARTGTNTRIYSWQWKDSSNNLVSFLNTPNTQSAVSGTLNYNDYTGNALGWSTTYVLHVKFQSFPTDLYERSCTFSVTTPAQPTCGTAQGPNAANQFTTNFNY